MTCRDCMTANPAFCIPTNSVAYAMQMMKERNVGALPIVLDAHDRRVVGIVTDRDLMIRVEAMGGEPGKIAVSEVMTADPVSCTAEASYSEILDLLVDNGIRRLPVLDAEDRLIGIVTLDDLLQYVDWNEGRKVSNVKTAWAAGTGLCLAAGVGAGLMFLLDPSRGKGRRTMLRDKAVSACDKGKHILEHGAADLKNRATGMAAELRKVLQPEEPVSDETLVARVRTHLGRVLTHPHSIQVSAKDGCVVLTGKVRPYAMKNIASSVGTVRGVKVVDNRLIVQEPCEDTTATAGWRHPAQPGAHVASEVAGFAAGALQSLSERAR